MQLTQKYSFTATVMNMQLQWERALSHVAMEITAVKIKNQKGVHCRFFDDRVGEHPIPSSYLSPPRKDEVKEKKRKIKKKNLLAGFD